MSLSLNRPRIINRRGTYWLVLNGSVVELSFKTVSDAQRFNRRYTSATTNEERCAAIDSIIVRVVPTR